MFGLDGFGARASAPQLDFKFSDDAEVYERELDRLTTGQGPVSFELETAEHRPAGTPPPLARCCFQHGRRERYLA